MILVLERDKPPFIVQYWDTIFRSNLEEELFTLSVVTPVYNEEQCVEPLVDALTPILSSLTDSYEIIFCLDPSSDATESNVKKAGLKDNRIKLLSFNRRVGQDIAVLAGIEKSTGDAIIIMDCDLQDPPSAIIEMVKKWESGTKMVIGKRVSRKNDAFLKKLSSDLFYKFLNKMTEIPFPRNVGDFRLIDKSVAAEVNRFGEVKPFTKGIMAWIGAQFDVVEFERTSRKAGYTKYNAFFGGYQIAISNIISYSNVLLKFSLVFGLLMAIFSFIFGIVYGIMSFSYSNLPVGLPTTVILVSFLSGAILFSIGILGVYVDRIFDEVKHRPRYTIKEFFNG